MILKSTLRVSLLKGSLAMPAWQVAWVWLGGFKSHLLAEALWALMHINERVLSHSDKFTLNANHIHIHRLKLVPVSTRSEFPASMLMCYIYKEH